MVPRPLLHCGLFLLCLLETEFQGRVGRPRSPYLPDHTALCQPPAGQERWGHQSNDFILASRKISTGDSTFHLFLILIIYQEFS